MEIVQYISTLLLTHECVIVPELGGFVSTRRPATIDQAKGVVTPPYKQVSFNRMLSQNDGLLVKFIADNEGFSYHDAEHMVKRFVKKTLKDLDNKAVVLIPEVGKLSTDAEGNIQFVQTQGRNLLIDSFGLSAAHFTNTYKAIEETAEEVVETESKVIALPEVAAKQSNNSGTRWLQIAASLLLVSLMGVLMSQDIYPEDLSLTQLGVVDMQALWPDETPTSEEVALVVNETPVVEEIVEPTPMPALPNAEVLMVADQQVSEGYYLVWASFNNKKNADKMVRFHKKEQLSVMQSADGNYRVVLFAGSNAELAQNSLDHYRTKKYRSNTWMLYNLH